MLRATRGARQPDQGIEIEPGVDEAEVRKVTITGTRAPTPAIIARVCAVIASLPAHTIVITGGCVGVDALAARAAHARRLYVHTVLPSDHSRVDPAWRENCDSWEQMLPGSSYRDRDERMVHRGQEVIAFPLKAESEDRRSGTWMTVRLGRQAGKPVGIEYGG